MYPKKYRFGQKHLLLQGLGISGIATESSSWRFVPKKDDTREGAQIDLVISRADKIIHLVEMKFCETPYVIKKDYEERLKKRKALFMEVTDISRGPVITFISPMGISQGAHSSVVHSQLTSTHLFAKIIL